MLQITVNNPVNPNVFTHFGYARDKRAVTTHKQIYPHTSRRCFIELLYQKTIGDMINFRHDISRLARFGMLNLRVYHRNQLLPHIIRRYQQMSERNRRIGLLNKAEYGVYLTSDGFMCSHQREIGISPRISLMEIPRTDTSDVTFARTDMQQLGMHFQPFHPKNHPDTRVLHLLRPVDVGGFIKTSQQFDDNRHVLPVLRCAYQRLYHPRIFGQTVERSLYAFHIFTYRRFPQYPQIGTETVVGIMQVTIFGTNRVQNASFFQLRFEQRRLRQVFQITPPAIRETHQIFQIMITPAGNPRIRLVDIQFTHNQL